MIYLIVLFAATIFLYYLSLKIQAKYKFYTYRFGKNGFVIHCILTGLMFIFLFFSFLVRNTKYIKLPIFYPVFIIIGNIFELIGAIIIVWSFLILGIKRTWGIRYFEKTYKEKIEKRGPYRFLINPIYDGFFILLTGKALSFNSLFHLIIAVESFILLNVFLARFENKEIINK